MVLGRKILVLTENELLSELITSNLRKRGYEAKSTSLARNDWCRWTDPGVELVLLDVEPPGRDALEAVQSLEHLGWPIAIPLVALCDELPCEDGVVTREGLQWVVKPFSVELLLTTVRQALGSAGATS